MAIKVKIKVKASDADAKKLLMKSGIKALSGKKATSKS